MKAWTREKRLRTRSENGTLGLGEIMTEMLPAPKLVVLRGELGMGKTTLVKGMAAALGASADDVTSPTFTLVHEYQAAKGTVYHLDLYRLEAEQQLAALGFDEMADEPGALVLVEWGEKFSSVLERADAEVAMAHLEGDERSLWVRW